MEGRQYLAARPALPGGFLRFAANRIGNSLNFGFKVRMPPNLDLLAAHAAPWLS
jgi:hypothetical protein